MRRKLIATLSAQPITDGRDEQEPVWVAAPPIKTTGGKIDDIGQDRPIEIAIEAGILPRHAHIQRVVIQANEAGRGQRKRQSVGRIEAKTSIEALAEGASLILAEAIATGAKLSV